MTIELALPELTTGQKVWMIVGVYLLISYLIIGPYITRVLIKTEVGNKPLEDELMWLAIGVWILSFIVVPFIVVRWLFFQTVYKLLVPKEIRNRG
jgi:hypothetical protein